MFEVLFGPIPQTGLAGNAMQACTQSQLQALDMARATEGASQFYKYLEWIERQERSTLPARYADFCRRLDATLARHGLS